MFYLAQVMRSCCYKQRYKSFLNTQIKKASCFYFFLLLSTMRRIKLFEFGKISKLAILLSYILVAFTFRTCTQRSAHTLYIVCATPRLACFSFLSTVGLLKHFLLYPIAFQYLGLIDVIFDENCACGFQYFGRAKILSFDLILREVGFGNTACKSCTIVRKGLRLFQR